QPDRLPVELDAVARADERVQLTWLTVHRDATGLDQLVRPAPRGNSCASQVGVQPHAWDYRLTRLRSGDGEGLVARQLGRAELGRRPPTTAAALPCRHALRGAVTHLARTAWPG